MHCGNKIKFFTSLYITKALSWFIKIFNLGSGHTWPGNIALKIYPDILEFYSKFDCRGNKIGIGSSNIYNDNGGSDNHKGTFIDNIVLITGTNGKTTTTKLISYFLEKKGFKVVSNKTGANLLNGIVSEILLNTNFLGKINFDVGVFEVDELHLPSVLKYFEPKAVLLLNLSRDQLDRYSEIDYILDKWKGAFDFYEDEKKRPFRLFLDSSQRYFDIFSSSNNKSGRDSYFNIKYFENNNNLLNKSPLIGDFNAKNIDAASETAYLFGLSNLDIRRFIEDFDFAYGRGEEIAYKDKNFKLLLAKNPTSFNNNLRALLSGSVSYDSLIYILNDNIPDGRDVSWIYDIKSDLLNKVGRSIKKENIFISGKRYLDMAVRIGYADISLQHKNLVGDIKDLINSVAEKENIKDIVVLPNYSAMLKVREILLGRKIL